MNTPLHPDLAQIENHYNELVDNVDAGNMTVKAAMETLANIQIVDGNNLLWGMDGEGNFVSGVPGTQLQITDPSQYRSTLEQPGQNQNSWETPDLMRPPTPQNFNDTVSTFSSPQTQVFNSPTNQAPDDDFEDDYEEEKPKKVRKQAVRKPNLKKSNNGSIVDKVKGSVDGALAQFNSTPLGDKIRENKRTVGLAAIAVVVIMGILIFNQKGSDETPVDGGVPTSTLEEMPSDNGAAPIEPVEPAAEPAAADAPVPDPGKVTTLLTALTSGDRTLTIGAVLEPGDESAIAINTAQFTGYKDGASGLVLTAGPAVATADGAVADLNITNKSDNSTLKTVKMNLVKSPEGTWVLKTWPAIN